MRIAYGGIIFRSGKHGMPVDPPMLKKIRNNLRKSEFILFTNLGCGRKVAPLIGNARRLDGR
jgi:hypothetical protein